MEKERKTFEHLFENKKFHEEKIQTAQFYFNRVLPRAESHFKSVKTGSDYIMKFNFNWYEQLRTKFR